MRKIYSPSSKPHGKLGSIKGSDGRRKQTSTVVLILKSRTQHWFSLSLPPIKAGKYNYIIWPGLVPKKF
jgi:hypothetical protein